MWDSYVHVVICGMSGRSVLLFMLGDVDLYYARGGDHLRALLFTTY